MTVQWIPCPACGANTRTRVRPDTRLYHHLLYCPKCRGETLVNVERCRITIVYEPDAKTQRS